MPVYIALLRGINVTGNNIIKMEDLRALCTKLKWEGAQTFIQSGNIVFRSPEADPADLAKTLGDAIEKKYKFRPEIMLRAADELRAVVAAHPFRKRKEINNSNFAVF